MKPNNNKYLPLALKYQREVQNENRRLAELIRKEQAIARHFPSTANTTLTIATARNYPSHRGGFAFSIQRDGRAHETSGNCPFTTPTHLDLLAMVPALEACAGAEGLIDVMTTTDKLVDLLKRGVPHSWRRDNWHNRHGNLVDNVELWSRLLDQYKMLTLRFVRPQNWNPTLQRCKALAAEAASRQ